MVARVTIAFIAAVLLTVVPAAFHGHYENRWGDPVDLTAAGARIQTFPSEFGNWKATGDEGEPLHEVVYRELGLVGYLSRTYVNSENGSIVNLLLMVGHSGPLVRHPPNICYANRANEQVGDMTKLQVDATTPASEFNLLEYKRAQSVTNDRFLVTYAMAPGPAWSVPSMPRLVFGGEPVLYKVQMLLTLSPTQNRESGVAILKQFATGFCTAFQQHMISENAEHPRQAEGHQASVSKTSS